MNDILITTHRDRIVGIRNEAPNVRVRVLDVEDASAAEIAGPEDRINTPALWVAVSLLLMTVTGGWLLGCCVTGAVWLVRSWMH